MKKRLLAALLTSALALSLTACGGGDSTPAQTGGDSAGTASHDGVAAFIKSWDSVLSDVQSGIDRVNA